MPSEMWVDTNIIIRFLTNDHPVHSPIAKDIMRKVVEGKLVLHVNPFVIGECVFVLQGKHYNFSRIKIASKLKTFLSANGIECMEEDILKTALNTYSDSKVDFADAYIPAYADESKHPQIITFNTKDFQRAEAYHPADVLTIFEVGES